MIEQYSPNAETWALLDAACCGGLDAGQTERLETALREDERLRDFYLDYFQLHAELTRSIRLEHVRENIVDSIRHPKPLVSEPPLVIPSLSPLPSLPTTRYPLPTDFVGGPVFSYMVASVVLCLMLLGGWAYKITHVDPARSAVVGQENQNSPLFVGRVTGMKDCVWPEDALMTMPGASVPMGRKYSLDSGLLEITYASGARVILEGPCSYTVDSDAGGFLQVGKLVARVEKNDELRMMNNELQSHNSDIHHSSFINHPLFSVRTPTAVVTDLGTEFGVEVGELGDTITHVFRGSVKMQIARDSQSIDLRKGESAKISIVDSGRPSIAVLGISYKPRFVLEMPESRSAAASAYREMVLSLNPVVYYRMDCPKEKTSRVVSDSTKGWHHGELRLGDVFGGYPYRTGKLGEALCFRGPDVKDYAIVPDYPKATHDQLTVSAWVFANSRPVWAMIVSNWANLWRPGEGPPGQFHFGLCRGAGDLSARITQRNGIQLELREGGDRPLPLYSWQHVALVADGEALRLYRNGKEVASSPCAGILAKPPVESLGIGCTLNETGSAARDDAHPGSIFWQGRIDELAIFNQALSDEQINLLFTGKQISKETDDAEEGGIK